MSWQRATSQAPERFRMVHRHQFLPNVYVVGASFRDRRSRRCRRTSGHSCASTLYMYESRAVPSRRA